MEHQPETACIPNNKEWHPAVRVLFRFVFVFLTLFIFPFPMNRLPVAFYLSNLYSMALNPVIVQLAKYLFGLSLRVPEFNGSGDTSFNYVQVAFFLFVAFIATIIWSILDKNRINYYRLYAWLRLYARLWLACTLLSYGMFKVIPSQFGPPSLSRLVETYGESSPMGLLWTFMGASPTYTIFTGAVETLAGFLLLFPRLTTLGSLLAMAAFTHVFMLNMSYDVPVKLESLVYLVTAFLLLIPDVHALLLLFVAGKKAALSTEPRLFQSDERNRRSNQAQIILGIYFVATAVFLADDAIHANSNRSPFYGIWSVDQCCLDGNADLSRAIGTKGWRYLVLDNPATATMRFADLTGLEVLARTTEQPPAHGVEQNR